MIRSFDCQWVEDFYHGIDSITSSEISAHLCAKIHRIFDHLNTLTNLESIRLPGANTLEKYANGIWSLRLDEEWRIFFKWFEGDVYNLDLVRS